MSEPIVEESEELRHRLSETDHLIKTLEASRTMPLSLAANIRSLKKLRRRFENDLADVERSQAEGTSNQAEANPK